MVDDGLFQVGFIELWAWFRTQYRPGVPALAVVSLAREREPRGNPDGSGCFELRAVDIILSYQYHRWESITCIVTNSIAHTMCAQLDKVGRISDYVFQAGS